MLMQPVSVQSTACDLFTPTTPDGPMAASTAGSAQNSSGTMSPIEVPLVPDVEIAIPAFGGQTMRAFIRSQKQASDQAVEKAKARTCPANVVAMLKHKATCQQQRKRAAEERDKAGKSKHEKLTQQRADDIRASLQALDISLRLQTAPMFGENH